MAKGMGLDFRYRKVKLDKRFVCGKIIFTNKINLTDGKKMSDGKI